MTHRNYTTPELYQLMLAGGYSLKTDGVNLTVEQARWIDDELADLIRTHKPGLIKILESENNDR